MIISIIFGSFLVLVCLVVVIVYLAMRGMGQASGLEGLGQRFPAAASYQGVLINGQTVMVGEVRFRNCTTVGINPEGLYLHVNPPLGHYAPVFIPWHEIRQAQPSRLYWLPAVRLQVGISPAGSITIYQSLFEQMRPYLSSNA